MNSTTHGSGVRGMSEAERVAVIRGTTEYLSWFPIKPTVRPCDQPGGCNASNCLGCGETRADGVKGVDDDKA